MVQILPMKTHLVKPNKILKKTKEVKSPIHDSENISFLFLLTFLLHSTREFITMYV